MINYDELSTKDKRLITTTLNLKRTLISTKEDFDKYSNDIFDIVKLNGKVTKGKDVITFIPEGKGGLEFDKVSFAKDYPELYAKYLKPTKGKAAYLRYNLA